MMIKPWSISTTVRNPDRLRGFLSVLAQIQGKEWNHTTQKLFQIKLIQARLYGFGERQFYAGLTQQNIDSLNSDNDISEAKASLIFNEKNYEDPPMRGRNSFKPLQKLGFANIVGGCVKITETGESLLAEKDDYEEIFLRVLLKWQIPNPLDAVGFPLRHGYNIKPFVGALRLIEEVNKQCEDKKAKGLSRLEFASFALTLIDYKDIGKTAHDIVALRSKIKNIPVAQRDDFFKKQVTLLRPNFTLKNIYDYADNVIRYFRLTKYIRVQEWGGYVNLEPLKKKELTSLFKKDSARPLDFPNNDYVEYLSSIHTPDLPGETKSELIETIVFLRGHIKSIGGQPSETDISNRSVLSLKTLRHELLQEQRHIINIKEKDALSQPIEVEKYIKELYDLQNRRGKGRLSIELERLVSKGLMILNDAEKIKPNYPLGDDGMPSSHALPGKADIECFYKNFSSICEVTMLTDSKQWMHEAQPVMRHLQDFSRNYPQKQTYCLFIAPSLHKDTLNMFRVCAMGGYEGEYQKIAPLTIGQFHNILQFSVERIRQNKPITCINIKALLDNLSASLKEMTVSNRWHPDSENTIQQWKQQV